VVNSVTALQNGILANRGQILMNIPEMLQQSGMLAIMGVGTVFGFLFSIVICITIMGNIFHTLEKNKKVQETTTKNQPNKDPTTNQGEIVAAITAAVSQYRETN
jgi:sodium pump decarboxylase gamma subunit